MKIKLLSVAVFGLAISQALAADWYVSKESGKNKNEGKSPATAVKNIQKAIDLAAPGDVIRVAQGNYYGMMNKGNIILEKGLSIIGGYAPDFSSRDVLKFKTLLQPTNESNGTGMNFAVLQLKIADPKAVTVIDGLIFDKGESNNYHHTEGVVEGVAGGMLLEPPAKEPGKMANVTKPLLSGECSGTIEIKNCAFVNGNNFGIRLGIRPESKAIVTNNIFIANSYAGAQIYGMTASNKPYPSLEFANNTILFSWSRTKTLETMGYGFRFMTGMNYNFHDNVVGFSCFSGTDATFDDKKREIKLDKNVFMLNKKADLTLPGGGTFLRLWVKDFEDLELASNEGNTALKDPAALKNILNMAYVNGFLSASYSEHAEYDENSPANQFRAAMGMNKQGKLSTKVSMFSNKYPLDDALKFFGAIPNCGAQVPKN